jgi:hypothetical protein
VEAEHLWPGKCGRLRERFHARGCPVSSWLLHDRGKIIDGRRTSATFS